jgi:hypothetical protein
MSKSKVVLAATVWFALIWFAFAMQRDEEARASAQAHEEFQHYPYTSVPAVSSASTADDVDITGLIHNFKNVCTVLYFKTSGTRLSELKVGEIHLVNECEKLGMYKDNR